MAKLKPIKWFQLRLGGEPWWFYISHDSITSDLKEDGRPLYGIAAFETRRVYINAHFPSTTFFETVVHELDHIVFDHLEMPSWLEEMIVHGTDQRRSLVLSRMGLELPQLPDGYTELVAALKRRRGRRKR